MFEFLQHLKWLNSKNPPLSGMGVCYQCLGCGNSYLLETPAPQGHNACPKCGAKNVKQVGVRCD